MSDEDLKNLTYEQKEARLDQILNRLDNSQTPMDELAKEAKEASQLITSMHATLRSARQEITTVFEEMEKQKESLSLSGRADAASDGQDIF